MFISMELLLGSHFTFLYDCVFFEILIISFFICLGFSLRVHSVYCHVYRDIVPYCHATRVVHIWDHISLIPYLFQFTRSHSGFQICIQFASPYLHRATISSHPVMLPV